MLVAAEAAAVAMYVLYTARIRVDIYISISDSSPIRTRGCSCGFPTDYLIPASPQPPSLPTRALDRSAARHVPEQHSPYCSTPHPNGEPPPGCGGGPGSGLGACIYSTYARWTSVCPRAAGLRRRQVATSTRPPLGPHKSARSSQLVCHVRGDPAAARLRRPQMLRCSYVL